MVPGYLLEEVFDPTGAGDCFAGGFIGYLAEKGIDLKAGHVERQGTQPRRDLWVRHGQLLLREIRRGSLPHADFAMVGRCIMATPKRTLPSPAE
jgi:sugar/nucleoside kinase (ribokinase family)